MKKQKIIENVRLQKFVHGGQAMGVVEEIPGSSSGAQSTEKKILVWGGLPGELVNIRITKKKKSYYEGIVTEVLEASQERHEPEEPLSYLSTSPWQIVNFMAEIKYKDEILRETFAREGLPDLNWSEFEVFGQTSGYRNKMEFGFWGDDEGLHLAHFVRGSHGKQKVEGSVLTNDYVNATANSIRELLEKHNVWAGDIKTLMLRSSEKGEVVAALFIKKELDLSNFVFQHGLINLDIYYSDPKSPASKPTKKLYSYGDIKLDDEILGKNITYDVLSFFQVNVPIFEIALERIKQEVEEQRKHNKGVKVIDFYSGVGTIGICVGADYLVESDENNVKFALQNARGTSAEVIGAAAEDATEHISPGSIIIVDPPRAGLHKKVVERILEEKPSCIIYLSCNPSTQARDVKHLTKKYNISNVQGFNFFPRTPHIESLVVLQLKP